MRTVKWICDAHRLQPHRLHTFKRSRDPAFAAKVEDVVGLSMEPLYRLRIVRHRSEAYAAMAAGGSCAARISAGGRNPCRPISHVSL